MKKKAKKMMLTYLLLVFISIFVIGCFDYNDINNLTFATSFIIDVAENGNVVVYIETVRPIRNFKLEETESKRIIYRMEGLTVQEALRKTAYYKVLYINLSQIKAVIFTEKAAQKGLTKYLDFIDREQNFLLRPRMFIYEGDMKNIIDLKLKQDLFLGLHLLELDETSNMTGDTKTVSLSEMYANRVESSHTYVLPRLFFRKQLNEEFSFGGLYVLVDDKINTLLDNEKTQYYLFLTNGYNKGVMNLPHPNTPDKLISIAISNVKTKSKLVYDGERIKISKKISVRCDFSESQADFNYTRENMHKITDAAEAKIKKNALQLFKEYQEKDIDIFGVGKEFKLNYPREKIDNPLEIAELELEVKVGICCTEDTLNFR